MRIDLQKTLREKQPSCASGRTASARPAGRPPALPPGRAGRARREAETPGVGGGAWAAGGVLEGEGPGGWAPLPRRAHTCQTGYARGQAAIRARTLARPLPCLRPQMAAECHPLRPGPRQAPRREREEVFQAAGSGGRSPTGLPRFHARPPGRTGDDTRPSGSKPPTGQCAPGGGVLLAPPGARSPGAARSPRRPGGRAGGLQAASSGPRRPRPPAPESFPARATKGAPH